LKRILFKNLIAVFIAFVLLCITSAIWTEGQLQAAQDGLFCVATKDDNLARATGQDGVIRRQLASAVLVNRWPGNLNSVNRKVRSWVIYGPGMMFTNAKERAAYYDALPRCSDRRPKSG